MKFKDIPKFTRAGSYQVNMPLNYFVKWVKENQIEFLLRGGKSGKVVYFNCPLWSLGSRDCDFVCVDGLQRTTAIMRFIDNEIPAFGVYYKDFEDNLPMEIDIIVNINELKTRKEVLKWYIEMNEGGTPHTEEEIERVKRLMESE